MRFLGSKRFNDALSLLSRANAWTDPRRFARCDSLRVLTYGNLACCFRKCGRHRFALECARQAVRTALKSHQSDWEEPVPAAFALLSLCTVLSTIGLHEEALLASQRAIVECRNELRIARSRLAQCESTLSGVLAEDEQRSRAESLWEDRMGTLAVAYYNLGAELEHVGLPGGHPHFQRAAVLARRAGPGMEDFAVACRHAAREADQGAGWSSARWSPLPSSPHARPLHRKTVQRELERSCSVDSAQPYADVPPSRQEEAHTAELAGIAREVRRVLQLRRRGVRHLDHHEGIREEERGREEEGISDEQRTRRSSELGGAPSKRGRRTRGRLRRRGGRNTTGPKILSSIEADQILYRLWGARALTRSRVQRPWIRALLRSLPDELRADIGAEDETIESGASHRETPGDEPAEAEEDVGGVGSWADHREPSESTWWSLVRQFRRAGERASHARQAALAVQSTLAQDRRFELLGTKQSGLGGKRNRSALLAMEETLQDMPGSYLRMQYLLTMLALTETSALQKDHSTWFTITPAGHRDNSTTPEDAMNATKILASGHVHWIANSEELGPNPPAVVGSAPATKAPPQGGSEEEEWEEGPDNEKESDAAEQLALTFAVTRLVRAWRSGRTSQWQLDDEATEAYMEGRRSPPMHGNTKSVTRNLGARVRQAVTPEGQPRRESAHKSGTYSSTGSLPVRPVRREPPVSHDDDPRRTASAHTYASEGSHSSEDARSNEDRSGGENDTAQPAREDGGDVVAVAEGSIETPPLDGVFGDEDEDEDEEEEEQQREEDEKEEKEVEEDTKEAEVGEEDEEKEASVPYSRNDILNALLQGGGLSSLGLEEEDESFSGESSRSGNSDDEKRSPLVEPPASTEVRASPLAKKGGVSDSLAHSSAGGAAKSPREQEGSDDDVWEQDRMLAALLSVDRGPRTQQKRSVSSSSSESESEEGRLGVPPVAGKGRNPMDALNKRLAKRSGKRKLKRGWAKVRVLRRMSGLAPGDASEEPQAAANSAPREDPTKRKRQQPTAEAKNTLREAVMVLRVVRRLQRRFLRLHPRDQ